MLPDTQAVAPLAAAPLAKAWVAEEAALLALVVALDAELAAEVALVVALDAELAAEVALAAALTQLAAAAATSAGISIGGEAALPGTIWELELVGGVKLMGCLSRCPLNRRAIGDSGGGQGLVFQRPGLEDQAADKGPCRFAQCPYLGVGQVDDGVVG